MMASESIRHAPAHDHHWMRQNGTRWFCPHTRMPAAHEHVQHTWSGYVMTTNPESERTLRTLSLLRSLRIEGQPFAAVQAEGSSEMDKVISNLKTQRGIYGAIASSEGPADEYVFVFEDDLALSSAVPKKSVTSLLACGALRSLRDRLPLLYAGTCAPRDVVTGSLIRQQSKAPTRVHARCAHAYAVRRGDAARLRQLADDHPDRGPSIVANRTRLDKSWYMDVQLDFLGRELGGFYLVAPQARNPEGMVGIFYQDRSTFPSTIGGGHEVSGR